ncbi:type VII toxin-antitoxin system MntA family adenylyltransferase antitoxin [Alloalcanivorax gelatiniphagus]|nr:nucleotidyltransferase domain-containing protein [Alloalcanivorax gelatiniphagus]|tara:strand:- start:421 stop:822 length:402 start_codon:yes stop_codon:yes gene_type:complete
MGHDLDALVDLLRDTVAELRAVFLFGSAADHTDGKDSDLDIALLSNQPLDPLLLWELSSTLADLAGCPVDLVDLRQASTVMKYQVVSKGQVLWQADHAGDLFVSVAQREYWDWEITRRPIMERIRETGSVYGR